MRDIQAERPTHELQIDKVGLRNLTFLVCYEIPGNIKTTTEAVLSCYTHLTKEYKGINMSRIPETIFSKFSQFELNEENIKNLLIALSKQLNDSVQIKIRTKLILNRKASISQTVAPVVYPITILAATDMSFLQPMREVTFGVNYMSVCPCSLAISHGGAHSQRSLVEVTYGPKTFDITYLVDLVNQVEECFPGAARTVLKRVDEAAVVDGAFDNPVFVEDAARKVATLLREKLDIPWVIVVNHFESIHQHDAVAVIRGGLK